MSHSGPRGVYTIRRRHFITGTGTLSQAPAVYAGGPALYRRHRHFIPCFIATAPSRPVKHLHRFVLDTA